MSKTIRYNPDSHKKDTIESNHNKRNIDRETKYAELLGEKPWFVDRILRKEQKHPRKEANEPGWD